ncbi:MAG: hypothetical protein U0804_04575 [Gemmataceae bacterium]
MSTAVTTRVEYEDRFAARPDLMKAAKAALAYLDGRLGTDPLVPPPSVIRWAIRPLDPNSVELSMADEDRGLRAVAVFPARRMADPQSRDLQATGVWGDLLAERSRVNQKRIDEKFRAYLQSLEDNPQ